MIMNTIRRLTFILLSCSVGLCLNAAPQQQESDAALDTIAIINQVNYAVEVIRTYHNVVALEEEYERISADNLNLNCIRDEESLQLIRDILNTLNSMRMNDRARKWYRHVLTRDLRGAKLEGMAKMANMVTSSFVNGSGGFLSRLGQLASATVVAGVETVADYKKAEHALQGQLEDRQFELDTEKLNELHKMNDMLLARQWNLINKYHLDDRLRVTGREVRSLVRCLKGSNRKNTFRQLKPMQRVFEVYPTYWYYRAAMAMATADYKDALASCEHFESINRGLFRTDQMAANVAMIKITAMLEQRPQDKALSPQEKASIEKGLDTICEQNYSSENADQSIFCTSVYLSVLDDVESASAVLESLMAKLDSDSQEELKEYCDLFTRPAEKKGTPPNTVYLVQCRMLRLAIDQKKEHKIHVERLKEICGRETTCSLEKLFYFGELRIEDLWKLAEKDIEKINLLVEGDHVVAEIPVTWFLLGDLDVTVEMLHGTNVVETLLGDDKRRSHVMSSPHLVSQSKAGVYVRIAMPTSKNSVADCNGMRLRLKHVSWPVDLAYAPEKPLKSGSVYFIPVRVQRFMGRNLNKIVRQDPMEELKSKVGKLMSAAENGDADSQVELGICYYKGEGVEQDKVVAVQWFRKAAEQNDADAQYRLGRCYYNGNGVDKDLAEAMKWYRKAAENGHNDAKKELEGSKVQSEGKSDISKIAVEVNGKRLTYSDLEADIAVCLVSQKIPEEQLEEAKKYFREQLAQQFVMKTILLDEAHKKGVKVHEEDRRMAEAELAKTNVNRPGSPKTFAEVIEKHPFGKERGKQEIEYSLLIRKLIEQEVASKVQVNAQEVDEYMGILTKRISNGAEFTIKEIKKHLEGLEGESLKVKFAELARVMSECTSKEKGGDLGEFARGIMVKEFERIAFKSKPFVVSDPVKTKFGWHLILVTKKIPAVKAKGYNPASPEKVQASHILIKTESREEVPTREQVEKELRQQRVQPLFRKYFDELRATAKIVAPSFPNLANP